MEGYRKPYRGSVRLRAVEPEDAMLMWLAENDGECADVSDYMAPLSRRQLEEYALTYDADPFRAGQLRLIVELSDDARDDVEGVGIVDLYDISLHDMTAWVGIYLAPSWRGRGVGGRALRALAGIAFGRLGLAALGAKVTEGNKASLCLFAGWRQCGVLPAWRRCGDGCRRDVYLFQQPSPYPHEHPPMS